MGGGLSSIPAQIDKETFRQLVGGSVNDSVFDANSTAGVMSRDKLIELSHQRDTMLSHEWYNSSYRPLSLKLYLTLSSLHRQPTGASTLQDAI